MPLIIGSRPVLPAEIVGIDRPIGEWNLIVVGVVERRRQRVREAEPQPGSAPLGADEQCVVVRVHARFEVDDAIRSADHGIEHLANGPAGNEMRADVVDTVDAKDNLPGERALEPKVPLLHTRILQSIIDDVDSRRAGAGKNEPGEGVGKRRRDGRKPSGCRIQKEHIAGPYFDRQRATVQAAFERLDLKGNPVVIDPVSAAHARLAAAGCPIEPQPRAEVVRVARASPAQERLHQRVDLAGSADVLDVGVQLVTQADVQREILPHTPVVLHKRRKVVGVGIRQHERAIGTPAPQRDGKEQILIVHPAIAVVIEGCEILDELDASLTEDAEVEPGIHALPLPAGAQVVRPAQEAECVGDLESLLRRSLRDTE